MPNVGPLELIIVLVIVLVIFGARRVPEAGKNLGKGIREFKGSLSGDDKDDDDEVRELGQARREGSVREEEAPLEGEVVHDRRS